MARTVRDANLETRTARSRLKVSGRPYYRAIDTGLHLGYRKGKTGGKWVVRRYIGSQSYEVETLDAIPDDVLDGDGAAVLNFGQAQAKARELFAARNAGLRPAGPLTVTQACAAYVEYLRAEKKTGGDAEQRIAKHVLPALGDRPVAALTRKELERWKHKLIRRDPDDPDAERANKATANRMMTSLKAALNRVFGDEENGIASDRAWRDGLKQYKGVGGRREVFLDEAQSRRLVNVCQGAFRDLVVAALLTGARPPHELAAARVRDFHARLGTLRVDGKTGPRDIVLTKEAVAFFEEISAGREPDALLLPRDDGGAWGKNHHIRPMQEAVKKAKLPNDCTIYAARHTYASQALMNGMNVQLLAENMGTSVRMIEETYGKFTAGKRRELIEASSLKLGIKPSGKVKRLEKVR